MFRKLISAVLLFAVLSGCTAVDSQHSSAAQGDFTAQHVISLASAGEQDTALVSFQTGHQVGAQAGENTPTPAPSQLPTQAGKVLVTQGTTSSAVGPMQFPAGINPLTGKPVKNSANLALSPALVSVTNFPTTARPQAGLSFSPFVFEMYIGEGMTRFLAVFYGDYPEKGQDKGIALADDKVGPVRSGRLPYESLRKLFNGFLVMASASPNVISSLGGYTNVFGSDQGDINSAMIPATKLAEIATRNPDRLKEDALSGLRFDPSAPNGGKSGKMVWIPYSFLNQVLWRYDSASGAYLRYQDDADGKTFIQAKDRLNNQNLAYSNVVVLFANHRAKRETLIDIDLMYQTKMPAVLFRDGKMYEIYWTTANSDYEKKTGLMRPIRFIDAQGNPFPLKPGQTWVEMVPQFTRYNETVDTQSYFDMKNKVSAGSGNWAIQFYAPVPER